MTVQPSRNVKLEKQVQVKNTQGLHTRPATAIVRQLQTTLCEVTITYRDETVNAKSVLGILLLAANKNARLMITVEGEESDAQNIMTALVQGFETKFGE